MGIVNEVTDKREWMTAALELAHRVAKRPPLAAKLAKQAVLAAEETALSAGPRPGAPPLRARDGDRGPGRGHAGLPGKAQARVPGALTTGCRTSTSPSGTTSPSARGSRTATAGSGSRPAPSGWARACTRSSRARRRSPTTGTTANEEALLVLEGTVTVREPGGTREVGAGEVVAFPRGERGAHQLYNRGGEPARFIVLSEMNWPDPCVYPDSARSESASLRRATNPAPASASSSRRPPSTTGRARHRRRDQLHRPRVRPAERARGLRRAPCPAGTPGRV